MTGSIIHEMAMAIAIKERTWLGPSAAEARRAIEREGGPSRMHMRQARAVVDVLLSHEDGGDFICGPHGCRLAQLEDPAP